MASGSTITIKMTPKEFDLLRKAVIFASQQSDRQSREMRADGSKQAALEADLFAGECLRMLTGALS